MARSRNPLVVVMSGAFRSAWACLSDSQFPPRTPMDFALFTRAIPAASSGASRPLSVASTASLRMADMRMMIDDDPGHAPPASHAKRGDEIYYSAGDSPVLKVFGVTPSCHGPNLAAAFGGIAGPPKMAIIGVHETRRCNAKSRQARAGFLPTTNRKKQKSMQADQTMTVAPPSSQILVKTNAWIGGTKDQMARRPIDQNNQGHWPAKNKSTVRRNKRVRPPCQHTAARAE
jgi:hypothetical protein